MATRERTGSPAAPTELIGPPGLPPEETPPDRELWPWLLVLLVLVIAGLAAAWYATRDSSGASGPVTVQTTVAAARAKPKPVRKHAQTAATTTAPQTVVVPDLVGQSRDDAVSTLEAQGLTADVQEVPSSTADGTVVSQHPAGGTKVDAQSGVLINVGRKVEPKHAAPAPKETTTTEKAKVRPPQPKPAKTVSNTTPQTPATVTVPSVVGEDEGSARADLVNAGFSPVTVDQATSDPTQDGMVIDQSPSGGSSARPTSTVTIYVARFSGTGDFSTG